MSEYEGHLSKSPPSPEEISALYGAAGHDFRRSAAGEKLSAVATRVQWTREKLLATALLNRLLERSLGGDGEATQMLDSFALVPQTLPPDTRQEALRRLAFQTQQSLREAQQDYHATSEELGREWQTKGIEIETAAERAQRERLTRVGLLPEAEIIEGKYRIIGEEPARPSLEEVAADLRSKREQLDLLEQAAGGKSEAFQELREKHGVNYQVWQKDQIEEYAGVIEKQVREAESRFNAMRSAQQERERAPQREWGEQLQELTEEVRVVNERSGALEALQEKIGRQERVNPEEFRRLGVELVPGRKVEEAVAAEQVGVENELASINARLEDLKAVGPTTGQGVAEKMAGVEVAPRVAARALSQPQVNWEVLGGMETGEQMLTIQESQVRLREELTQLNKLASGDEGAKLYWQEKGAPTVWKREDLEAAAASREETLRQLDARDKELLPEYEQWRKGAVESYQEALLDKELSAKEPQALLGKLGASSESAAISQAEEVYLQAKDDLSVIAAVGNARAEITKESEPIDLRTPSEVTSSEGKTVSSKDVWAKQAEFARAKAELAEVENQLANPEYLEKVLKPQREKIQDQVGHLNREINEAREEVELGGGRKSAPVKEKEVGVEGAAKETPSKAGIDYQEIIQKNQGTLARQEKDLERVQKRLTEAEERGDKAQVPSLEAEAKERQAQVLETRQTVGMAKLELERKEAEAPKPSTPFERQKELHRLQNQLKEIDEKTASVSRPVAELERRGTELEARVRSLTDELVTVRPELEKEAVRIEQRHEKLLGYANRPDLLVQVYEKPLEEAEVEHAKVLAQSQEELNKAHQFLRNEAALRRLSPRSDLRVSPRWEGVAMTEAEADMPFQRPEKPEEVASTYLRDDQRRQGGWEAREQWQKELHREMGRKEVGIAGLREEIAETERQLGLVSGKATEQLQKHGEALERKVKALETEVNNLRGIERVGLVDEHGKSLAAGAGGGAAGRVKSDLVGYGLVDEKGQWNKEIFAATPGKAAAAGERVRQAEASISKNLYVDAANRSLGNWERETVKKALGGAVDSRKKEWISRSGLLGEEREKYAADFHGKVTELKKGGSSETQAFKRALGEVKTDSLKDSASFKERRDWILSQVEPKDRQAVAVRLDAALGSLPKDGLAKAGLTSDYQVQLLTGQAQAGQAPDVVLKIGASRGTYSLQPTYDQALAQAKEMATKYGLADEIGKWHATWQNNPLRATTQLLLGETGTGVLWGDSKYLVKALPGPLGKFFQPEKYLLSTEARGISTLYKDFKREGAVRFVVARTLGYKLGLYRKVPIFKGEKKIGYKYVGAVKYFTSGLLHTAVTFPFRLPAGALNLLLSKSALSKFGFAKDITELLIPLLRNPGYGGLLPWGFQLAKAFVQVPLRLAGRFATRVGRGLKARAIVLLRRSTWGRNAVSFVRGLPGKLAGFRAAGALRLGRFLTGTKIGRFMSGAGKIFSRGASSAGVLVKGAGKSLFKSGSLAYGLLSGRVGVVELGLMLADKLKQMLETVIKKVAMAVAGAVAKAIGLSLGWVLAGCACVGCLIVLLIFLIILIVLGYCPYFPNFFLCRYFYGWKPRDLAPPPAALHIVIAQPPSYALLDPLAQGGTVLPVTATNTSSGPVMVSGVTGDMSYITAGEGRGASNFNSIQTGTEGFGSFTLSQSQITDSLLNPQSRYVSANNVVLNPGEKADFVLRVSGLRTDQDATYVTNLRFLYYEGADSTLPLQETHGIVEVRIGAGVSFGDDLFVQKINSLATCVSSDSVAYRVFSQECVPECAASLWNPWFNNLQCAVFIEGGQNCAGIKPIFGDAYQWFGLASRREDMAVYTNGAQCPRRGDVIVWEGGSQGWGHVAVVTDDGGLDRYDCSGRVEITQANTPRIKMNLNVYQGWVRAEGFEQAGFSLLGLIRRASF